MEDKKYNGLINHGATCYLNSVLQVLFMTRSFRRAVESYDPENQTTDDHIDRQLKNLFGKLSNSVPATKDIMTKLGIDQVYEQRDAADYFEKILNLSSDEASKGKLTHRNVCLQCGTQTEAHAPFWHLPLPLTDPCFSGYSVVEGVKQFFRSEDVRDENQLYCDGCDRKADTRMECLMNHHPDVLTLLLKRFEFDWSYMTYVKIDRSVEVPLTLHLPKAQTYELYALVEHSGNLWGGHYIATIRSQDGQDGRWYKFDDGSVTLAKPQPFQGDTEKSDRAYLLFYKKQRERLLPELYDLIVPPLDHGADACNQDTEETSAPEAPQLAPVENSKPGEDAEQVTDGQGDAHLPEEVPSNDGADRQDGEQNSVEECLANKQKIKEECETGGINDAPQKTPDIVHDSKQDRSAIHPNEEDDKYEGTLGETYNQDMGQQDGGLENKGLGKSEAQGGQPIILTADRQAGNTTGETSVETMVLRLYRLALYAARYVHRQGADACNTEGASGPEAPQLAPTEECKPQEETEPVGALDQDAKNQSDGGLENKGLSKSEVDHDTVSRIENAEESPAPKATEVAPRRHCKPRGGAVPVTDEQEGHKGDLFPEIEVGELRASQPDQEDETAQRKPEGYVPRITADRQGDDGTGNVGVDVMKCPENTRDEDRGQRAPKHLKKFNDAKRRPENCREGSKMTHRPKGNESRKKRKERKRWFKSHKSFFCCLFSRKKDSDTSDYYRCTPKKDPLN